jgi:hypothetical protein
MTLDPKSVAAGAVRANVGIVPYLHGLQGVLMEGACCLAIRYVVDAWN